jgi:predicted acetyltransferase
MMHTLICFAFLCVLFVASSEIKEPSTKHNYANIEHHLELAGVGVRIKQIGPIKAKVYSAAVYLEKAAATAFLKKLANKKNLEESIPSSGIKKQGTGNLLNECNHNFITGYLF